MRSVYGRADWKYSMNLNLAVIILHSIPLGERWRNVAVQLRSNYRLFFFLRLRDDPKAGCT